MTILCSLNKLLFPYSLMSLWNAIEYQRCTVPKEQISQHMNILRIVATVIDGKMMCNLICIKKK